MLNLWPWKLLKPLVAVNKPSVSWFNAVTRALTTMEVKFGDRAGIDRPNRDGSHWAIVLPHPLYKSGEAVTEPQMLLTWEGATCRPVTDAGKEWYLNSITKVGDDWVFDMAQRCARSEDEAGYCPYTGAITVTQDDGTVVTLNLANGVSDADGTYKGIDPDTGDPVELVIAGGVVTNYEGLVNLLDETTGESTSARVDADGLITGG